MKLGVQHQQRPPQNRLQPRTPHTPHKQRRHKRRADQRSASHRVRRPHVDDDEEQEADEDDNDDDAGPLVLDSSPAPSSCPHYHDPGLSLLLRSVPMTKGRVMISDLKSRTLSLFRRSSASSTRSASSTLSGSEQQYHSASSSPITSRLKRPASARSRSSLVVPRVKSDSTDTSVNKEEEQKKQQQQHREEGPSASKKQEEARSQASPTSTSTHPDAQASPTQAESPSTSTTSHSPTQRQQSSSPHKQHSLSSPLPLPTPEPSPLDQPDLPRSSSDAAPRLHVQPSTPEEAAAESAAHPHPHKPHTPRASSEHLETIREGEASGRPRRSLQLDLGTRPRATSAGKRSLADSRPRSPLHQSSTPDRTGSGTNSIASDQTSGQTAGAQQSVRPSQDQEPADYFSSLPSSPRQSRTPTGMAHSPSRYPQYAPPQPPRRRKIWVKRPNASATMVAINEDDMVDDARDMILRKYANSLGKSFDSPDVTLRIHPRDQPVSASQRSSSAQPTPSALLNERSLQPDEILARTLDVYFPGGQSVEEALIIDTPQPASHSKHRRTPRHSPGMHSTHYSVYGSQYEDTRPTESDKDYFPPGVVAQPQQQISGAPSPRIVGTLPVLAPGGHPHSIAVLNGAQLPALPSPREFVREGFVGAGGAEAKGRHRDYRRPKFNRQHTSSPTIVQHQDPRQNIASAQTQQAPALPTPPHGVISNMPAARVATPPPRVASPRPKPPRGGGRKKHSASGSIGGLSSSSPQVSGLVPSVPPINVLVVEDNIINLKLLEAFLKRIKVRSHSAKDGREAVAKWREGGFHLVLMDIQLPLMNGLEATKEIRRLERVNGIGAFIKSADEAKLELGKEKTEQPDENDDDETAKSPEDEEKERERNRIGRRELFKSPVIIVALTASSLHSDRSEALAAGCNDFLTKPVNLTWLERKLKEWGCMQALIDFDGWRQWKDFQSPMPLNGPSPKVPQTPMKRSQLAISTTSPSAFTSNDSPSTTAKQPGSRRGSGGAGAKSGAKQSAVLKDLSSKTESADSTTTLDSMTSDDADSFDTALPSHKERRSTSPQSRSDGSPPVGGPSFYVQAPTPRQSTDMTSTNIDSIVGAPVPSSPRVRSPANSVGVSDAGGSSSPRSRSANGTTDGFEDREDWAASSAAEKRRRKRHSSGQDHRRVLSAVGEEGEMSMNGQHGETAESEV